ncbi:hypothetical protein PP175_07275 [Aneurinibacillus sp. Ricciae_BoGa-3]|uniref:hypothetical protein n=1 Tax=Aneurinibacillus sp. Ricciae_BoGa-3 TaxID=3022697 RepID=UPI0023408F76|nr:hypothetical protein [Aneurinibacillus sp. Ricciae_BoGa-3]WCK55736.1 hypothetical protein PP175_07275 [Aneurinibacillus sp. Ricciae_BoGa-3]
MDENKLVELMRSMMKEELKPINERLDQMDQRFDQIDQRMDRMDQRLDQMDQRYEEMGQIVRALRDGQEELKAQMEGISLDVHKLHGEVAALRQEIRRDQDLADMRAGRTERQIAEINSRIEQLENPHS